MLNKAGMVCAVVVFFVCMGWAQESRLDLSLHLGEAFGKESSGNGVVLSPTNNLDVFGTARLYVGKKGGLELTIGKTSNTQRYTTALFTYAIPSSATEYTAAFVYRPYTRGKYEAFVLGGAGALRFYPGYNTTVDGAYFPLNAHTQTRPAFLYGFGVDYRAYWRFAVRVQYRGLFYQAPDFSVSGLTTSAYGHLAEPSVGLVIKF